MDRLEQFLNFAEQAPTAFHAAAGFREMLEQAGYTELKETDPWLVDAGGKYFVCRNDSAVIAFEVPETGFAAFRIAAAHSDSPAFKLKERFEDKTEYYVRLNVEKYGGMIMSTWLDRPLSVAGRLAVRSGDGVATRLVNLDRDALLIPNMPIHFNRDINSGFTYDPQTDMLPVSTQKLEHFCASTALYPLNAARFRRIVNRVEAHSVQPERSPNRSWAMTCSCTAARAAASGERTTRFSPADGLTTWNARSRQSRRW